MRLAALTLLALVGCGGAGLLDLHDYGATISEEHGREFGCEARWVESSLEARAEYGEESWRARGCGFESEWSCSGDECRLRDRRSLGTGGP